MTPNLPSHSSQCPAQDVAGEMSSNIDDLDITAAGELELLSDQDLDSISGGRHHHRRHGRHGGRHGHSHSDFHKHSVSISGQTITAADGSSVTSFTMNVEDISSHTDQVIG
jgi:hypothetical protein